MGEKPKLTTFRQSGAISVTTFLHSLKKDWENNCMREWAVTQIFQKFVQGPAKATALNIVCDTGGADLQ